MVREAITSRTRRKFIKSAGVAGTVALAGCAGNSDNSGGSGSGGGDGDSSDGGSSGNTRSESYELTFWELFSGGEGPIMESIVNKFNEEQPLDTDAEVTINRQRTPWNEYYNKLFTALSGGEAPDMAVMHAAYLRAWDGGIDAIGSYADTASIKGDYTESHWDLVTVNDNVNALPMDMHPIGVYYNKDLFEQAGLDPESPPTNWEEFRQAGDAVVENTDAHAFTQSPYNDGFGSFRTWSSWVKQQGGSLYDDEWNPTFDSEAGMNIAQLFSDMTGDMGWAPATSEDTWGNNAFQNGTCAMAMNGTWYVAALSGVDDLNWGFFEPTVGPNKQQDKVWADGHSIVLPKKEGRSDAKSEIAAEVAHWMTTQNPSWGAEAGHLPAANSIYESDTFQNSPYYDKTLNKYVEMAEDGDYFYHPKVPNGDPNAQNWYTWLVDIWAQNSEPQAAIDSGIQTVSNGISE